MWPKFRNIPRLLYPHNSVASVFIFLTKQISDGSGADGVNSILDRLTQRTWKQRHKNFPPTTFSSVKICEIEKRFRRQGIALALVIIGRQKPFIAD